MLQESNYDPLQFFLVHLLLYDISANRHCLHMADKCVSGFTSVCLPLHVCVCVNIMQIK